MATHKDNPNVKTRKTSKSGKASQTKPGKSRTRSKAKDIEQAIEQLAASRVSNTPVQQSVLYQWKSYERPFKPMKKDSFAQLMAIISLFVLLLILIDSWPVAMLLVSFVFFIYIISTVEPNRAVHKITNWGIETEGKLFMWEQLDHFWIEPKDKYSLLVVRTLINWPRHLRLVLNPEDVEPVEGLLRQVLIEYQPPANWLDRVAHWLERHIKWEPT